MLLFRNRAYLYNSTCAMTKRKILTCMPPENGTTIYDVEVWQGDGWDARDYGQDYDFKRPFFDQFYELSRKVPIPSLAVIRPTMENSDYTNGITGAKNCYLIFSSSWNEDCLFSYSLWRSRHVVDCIFIFDSELCYGCSDLRNCYNLKYSDHCNTCSDSAFLFNCQACKQCYRCANLNHGEYCFENKQLTKSEFEQKIAAIDLGDRETVEREQKLYGSFIRPFPVKYYFGKNIENSSGDYLFNIKNCSNCHFVSDSEDLSDCLYLDKAKSSIMHAMFGNGSELIYNSVTAGDNVYNIKFSADCWMGPHDLEYCFFCCYNSAHCFGCVSLRKAEYCILNKQYTKEEYLNLTKRIRTHMMSTGEYGQFFPPIVSPFFYNHSNAMQFFPIDKKTSREWGFKWKDDESVEAPKETKTVASHIRDVPDSILGETLYCRRSGKAFKLIPEELSFYRSQNVPLPLVSPMERIREKLKFFNISPLEEFQCGQCRLPITTVYSKSGRPVFCEKCFQQEVY